MGHVLNQLKLAKNSSSKIRMKERFKEAGVNTASWIRANTPEAIIEGVSQFSESDGVSYPIVANATVQEVLVIHC
jgi:phosphoribosylaminoimidazole carboxylase (NCAIR synthetase)